MKNVLYILILLCSIGLSAQRSEPLTSQDSTLLIKTVDEIVENMEQRRIQKLHLYCVKGIKCSFYRDGKGYASFDDVIYRKFKKFKGSQLAKEIRRQNYMMKKFKSNNYQDSKSISKDQPIFEISFAQALNNGTFEGNFRFEFVKVDGRFLVAGLFH